VFNFLWKTWKNFGEIQMYTVEIWDISMTVILQISASLTV